MRTQAVMAAAFALALMPTIATAKGMHESQSAVERTRDSIAGARARTWHFQDARHVKRWSTRYLERRITNLQRLHRLHVFWWKRSLIARERFIRWRNERRSERARSRAQASSDLGAWMCIHNGEGAWNSNTGNGFYGGLQMDYGFMQTYGADYLARYGTADRWTPAMQIEVARRARDSGRGYSPWPNTARACGLI